VHRNPDGQQAAVVDGSRLTADQVRPRSAQVTRPGSHGLPRAADLLAESDRHDMWLRRLLDAERRGYARGHEAGFAAGWAASEADLAASWHALTEPVAHPERVTGRRIQAALAGERRDAAEHERAFVARAYNTAPQDRTAVQRAAALVYPPPGTWRRTA
jgi:hypothetical protein